MKKFLAFVLVLAMLILPVMSCDMAGGDETDTQTTDAPETDAPKAELRDTDEKLYVGYGRECITPYQEDGKTLIEGLSLTGYAEGRPAKTVKDDIYASVTAVRDDEGNTALICTLDLHSMTTDFAKSLQKKLERDFGVPEENIILNVTHTHAVPGTTKTMGNIVFDKVVLAAKAALDDLTLVTALYTGNVQINGMNFIRRYEYDAEGKAIAHLWDNDPYMPVVRFVRDGSKKDVILANWAAHCDSVKSNNPTTLSGDYVAYFRHEIEANVDAYVSFHLGASGDVNPSGHLTSEPTFPGTSRYGKQLANNLIRGLEDLKRCDIKSKVSSDIQKVRVEYDHTDDPALGQAATDIMNYFWDHAGAKVTDEIKSMMKEHGFKDIYETMYYRARFLSNQYDRLAVGAVSIGNVVFAVAPYEMFTVNGKAVKDSAEEFDVAFMCAYSNGMIGYIASEEAFNHYIYEVYSHLYVKETATVLQDSMIASIDKLGAN